MAMNMIFPILNDEARKLPVFVTSVGGIDRQECINRAAGFPSWHWLHVSSGTGRLELEGREYFLRHGMGFLMAPGVPHRYESFEAPWSTQWVTFEGTLAGTLTTQMMTASQAVFRLRNPDALEQGIARIHLACSLNNPLQAFEASALLQLFLVTVARNAVPWDARIPAEGEGGFQEVLRHIEENYHRPLILDEMAKIAHVTPQHLCRLFRQHVNARPVEYITRVRLQKAKASMLSQTDWPLHKIAEASGFGDPSYFSKQFRLYEGMTPMAFRQMYGN